MSQIITVQGGQSNVSLLGMSLSAGDKFLLSDDDFDKLDPNAFTTILTDSGPGILQAFLTLSSASTSGATVATWTPGFAGRIGSVSALVSVPVTTAAKTLPLGVFIDGVQVSGGILTVTSALATPKGKILPFSNVARVNAQGTPRFTPTSIITVRTTALPTTFVEGEVVLQVELVKNPRV